MILVLWLAPARWFRPDDSGLPKPPVQMVAEPSPAVTTLKSFTTSDPTISKDVVVDGEAWMANCDMGQTIRLFEILNPDAEACTVTYRAQLKTEALKGRAYLEMWCRLPGAGSPFPGDWITWRQVPRNGPPTRPRSS